MITPLLNLSGTEQAGLSDYAILLNRGLNDPEVSNIALMGGYCTGKTSIINTFCKYFASDYALLRLLIPHSKHKVKRISFLSLSDPGAGDGLENKLQSEIIRQLLLEEKPALFQWSKITRINARSGRAIFTIVALAAAGMLIYSLEWLRSPSTSTLIRLIGTAAVALIAELIGYIVATTTTKIRLASINTKELKFELTDEKSSFDSLFDEIQHFFKASGYDTVIFEDLDRFENVEIFESLRQLNYRLNHSKVLGRRKITFVYAVKDSLLPQAEDRTKLFELIIPVIPFMSPENAGEYLDGYLSKVTPYQPSRALRNIMARRAPDARQQQALAGMVALSITRIKGGEKLLTWLEDDKIAGMALVRFLYPAEYEKMLRGKSIIDEIYDHAARAKNDETTRALENATARAEAEKLPPKKAETTLALLPGSIEYYRQKYDEHRAEPVWQYMKWVLDADNPNEKKLQEKIQGGYDGVRQLLFDLFDAGALDDTFRLCLTPYHGDAKHARVVTFLTNNVARRVVDYDLMLSDSEISELTRNLTELDYRSPAFLNTSFVKAVLGGKVKGLTLDKLLELQGGELHNVANFCNYCLTRAEGHNSSNQPTSVEATNTQSAAPKKPKNNLAVSIATAREGLPLKEPTPETLATVFTARALAIYPKEMREAAANWKQDKNKQTFYQSVEDNLKNSEQLKIKF